MPFTGPSSCVLFLPHELVLLRMTSFLPPSLLQLFPAFFPTASFSCAGMGLGAGIRELLEQLEGERERESNPVCYLPSKIDSKLLRQASTWFSSFSLCYTCLHQHWFSPRSRYWFQMQGGKEKIVHLIAFSWAHSLSLALGSFVQRLYNWFLPRVPRVKFGFPLAVSYLLLQ